MEILLRTLLLGIVSGSVYALASVGVVLTYKTSGILNFGYGALALFTTFVHWQLTVVWGWPVGISAIVVVLMVAPLIGIFLDTQLFRRIEGQPPIIGVIATVGLVVLFQGLVILLWGGETRSVPSLFPSGTYPLFGGARIGKDQFGVLLIAAASAASLGVMLRYTRLGIAFRAVVNNRPVAGLMGVNTGFVSGLAWALGTSSAALTGILLAPRLLLDINFLPAFIIAYVLGAASVGHLRSLPLAYAGGLLIGILEALFIQYSSGEGLLGKVPQALPFLLVTLAVLFAPKALRLASGGASFVVRTRETVTRASSRVRATTGAGVFVLLALVPIVGANSISWKLAMTTGMAYAIVYLSLVILTGYSGQISLGHTAFMGIAAFTTAHLAGVMPMWLAFPLGALAAAPAGALIGLAAVRVHGLFLALITLAFAFMAEYFFFADPRVSGGEGGIAIPRPAGLHSETGLFYLVLVSLALCSLLATNLRTGRTGRVLAGMRDSETACRSLGIPVTKYKVFIFSLSAMVAGIGGITLSMILEQANSRSFTAFYSLIYMTLAVLGGIFHVGGAIVGGILFGIFPRLAEAFPFLGRIQYILFGLGATIALAQNPEGLFGELRRAGNAILSLRARKRPSEPAPVSGAQK